MFPQNRCNSLKHPLSPILIPITRFVGPVQWLHPHSQAIEGEVNEHSDELPGPDVLLLTHQLRRIQVSEWGGMLMLISKYYWFYLSAVFVRGRDLGIRNGVISRFYDGRCWGQLLYIHRVFSYRRALMSMLRLKRVKAMIAVCLVFSHVLPCKSPILKVQWLCWMLGNNCGLEHFAMASRMPYHTIQGPWPHPSIRVQPDFKALWAPHVSNKHQKQTKKIFLDEFSLTTIRR